MTAYTFPYKGNLKWLEAGTIFLTKHGSQAYGLATPTSDLDVKGVAIPPKAYFHGYLQNFEQAEMNDPDLVIYDIRKFFRLAANCNPNIIEILWTNPEDHLIVTPLGERLLANRDAFLSQKARHTFSGYALSQLKRIKRHYRWLSDPPSAPPTRQEMGLPPRSVLPRDQIAAADKQIQKQLDDWALDLDTLDPAARIMVKNQMSRVIAEMKISSDEHWNAAARSIGLNDNLIHMLDLERKYRGRVREWKQYQSWKKHRNPKRAALEAKYGYDSKHASHLVRLLKMCREIIEDGEVIVRRPDREEILAIKKGAWKYEELLEWAAEQDQLLNQLVKNSPLPRAPDHKALDRLCTELVEEHLRG